jgi:hypothetical protein
MLNAMSPEYSANAIKIVRASAERPARLLDVRHRQS